jgi:hypothetical protein
MTSREFTESMAFEHIEPDPAATTMRLMGQLVTLMANVHRDVKHKPAPYTLDDFLPDPTAPSKAEREARFADIMAKYAAARKAKVS